MNFNKHIKLANRDNKPIALFFDHGLGDFVNFLPVFEELKRQTGLQLYLSSKEERQYHFIYPMIYDLECYSVYNVKYLNVIDSIKSLELSKDYSKPYICAYFEFGLKPFIWKPIEIPNYYSGMDKKVGIHFFGHTGANTKFCPTEIAELIWLEIELAGFNAFEVHMVPQFKYAYKDCGNDYLPFINESNSLRFEEPNLEKMMWEISKCRYFIGVDAGPLYLAGAILGYDKCLGLENRNYINNFLPVPINTISIKTYKKGSVFNFLKKENKS
jgi:hypothetical protein